MIKTYIDTAIDTIQTSKKMFVDTFVKHDGLAKSFNDFVDAQTDYTKQAIDVSIKAGTNVYNTVTDKSFYIDTMKSVQESVQSFINTNTQEKGK